MTTFGQPAFRYQTVGSTQDVARDLVRAHAAPPGAIVTAQGMTAGRGRHGRTWHVPPGANVCLTAVGPAVDPATAWQIALVAGLAVAEALHECAPGAHARVRFPNDVYAAQSGRKLSGVLVETMPSADGNGAGVVPLVGIGVNVRAAPLPAEVASRAVSLEEAAGKAFDVGAVEAAVCAHLGACWDEWTVGGFAATVARWKPHLDAQARRVFTIGGQAEWCRVVDLAPDGTLTLETDAGARVTLAAAQAVFE